VVANKVTKTNRFQKRTAAKTAVVKNDGDEKKRTKTKTTERERQHDIGNLCLGH
jgi:hypothetical protein